MASLAQTVTARLGGRWYGSYGAVRCVVHDDSNPSLRLRDGDGGRLLVTCYAGCQARDILAELRRRGLLDDTRGSSGDRPQSRDPRRREPETRDRERRIGEARAIWRECESVVGTLAERYLRARGITLQIPPSLRFHPAMRHGPTGLVLPAMVGAVQAPDRGIAGIHRTFLRADGRDKAPLSQAKLSLGPISGGAVRLAAASPELAIGEGIETCLSFMQGTGIPTWAALSTGGLRSIVLPPLPCAATVYIATDIDPNHAGEHAATAAARRLAAEGRKVKIARPFEGKDFNDAIREGVA